LGIIAQSVRSAAYVPCVRDLPRGWSFSNLDVDDHHATFTLLSDRARDPVEVTLVGSCNTDGSVPVPPRAEGVRSSMRLAGISPSYRGLLFDVFPGGCVTYRFRFERGPHIGLMDDLQQAVGLYSRRQLRQELRASSGLDLDAAAPSDTGPASAAPPVVPAAGPSIPARSDGWVLGRITGVHRGRRLR
jgi:hypothetical protein